MYLVYFFEKNSNDLRRSMAIFSLFIGRHMYTVHTLCYWICAPHFVATQHDAISSMDFKDRQTEASRIVVEIRDYKWRSNWVNMQSAIYFQSICIKPIDVCAWAYLTVSVICICVSVHSMDHKFIMFYSLIWFRLPIKIQCFAFGYWFTLVSFNGNEWNSRLNTNDIPTWVLKVIKKINISMW